MDFRQTFQSVGRGDASAVPVAGGPSQQGKKDNSHSKLPTWLSILNMVVLIGALLLIIATAFAFIGNKPDSEKDNVDTTAYQAVFLNNGQVYFGKVKAINDRYITMNDVFYLTQTTTSTGTTSNDYTLVKLGCQQIHYPKDWMFVSRSQVTFWENLNKDGKVVKSIAEFKTKNPNGENCSTTSTDTQSTNSGTNATQNSSNASNNATNKSTTTQ